MNVHILDEWNDYLELYSEADKDIYFTEEYSKLYEDEFSKVKCIVCREDNKVGLMPFVARGINDFYDFETPYGYGGPLFNTRDEEFIHDSIASMSSCFEENRYICGLVRFHPVLNNGKQIYGFVTGHGGLEIIPDRKTIIIDIEPDQEEIWKDQISSKNRNMIRKAEKAGIHFEADYAFSKADDFIKLYEQTMDRLGADEFYLFDRKYYDELFRRLSGKAFIGIASLEDKTIAAAVFMYEGIHGHYHLSGSDKEYRSLGANNFLLWNAALELKKLGVMKFHLGGGTSNDLEDSLYKFKKSFSKNECEYYIGKWIFNRDEYENLCQKWELDHPELVNKYGSRLLRYRERI